MTEWEVVGVIVVLVGLIAAVLGMTEKITKPLNSLGQAMAVLTAQLSTLNGKLTSLDEGNEKTHRRIFDVQEKQNEHLQDHETRITVLEHDKKGGGA